MEGVAQLMPQVCEAPPAVKTSKRERLEPFGYQLLLDLYDCKKGACDDLGLCYDFLEQIVDVLRVDPQSPPYVFRTDAKRFPDKAGLSGWIPLVESGIQLHTLTPKDFISIDVYSCREFAIEPIVAFVRSAFAPKRIEHQFVERGADYYK